MKVGQIIRKKREFLLATDPEVVCEIVAINGKHVDVRSESGMVLRHSLTSIVETWEIID